MRKITKANRAALDCILRPLLAEPPLVSIAQDGEVTGSAADGTRVSLGNYTHAPMALLEYLTHHKTPGTW
jgi:hypothetical protein